MNKLNFWLVKVVDSVGQPIRFAEVSDFAPGEATKITDTLWATDVENFFLIKI